MATNSNACPINSDLGITTGLSLTNAQIELAKNMIPVGYFDTTDNTLYYYIPAIYNDYGGGSYEIRCALITVTGFGDPSVQYDIGQSSIEHYV